MDSTESQKKMLKISQHCMLLVTSLTNGFLKFLTRFSGRRRACLRANDDNKFQLTHPNGSSHYFRKCKFNVATTIILYLFISTIGVTEACTSRTVPRPRTTTTTTPPAPTEPATTSRPNITFHTYKCPEAYAKWYCLNGATCFTVKIGMEVLFNCECPDGFMGPRCEYKELEGSYLAGRPRVMLETASIAGGAVVLLFLSCVVSLFGYVRWHQRKKNALLENGTLNGHHNPAADVVDGQQTVEPQCCCSQIYNNSQLSTELPHPQQHQFQAVHHHHHPPLRPFGPHHDYQKLSMSDVILKR